MLKVFQPYDNLFNSNGDAVITGARAIIKKVDNADFSLELECPIEFIDYVKPQNIIVAPTPQGEQGFRIDKIEATRTKIKASCKHLFYDSANYLIADSYVVDKTCNEALDHLNEATDTESPFTTLSDITTLNSYRCVRKSLAEAIATVLERWGGHLVRDNFNIKILANIGADNGVTIQYGKNIKEISVNYNWDNVCTKLLPVGKDGFLLSDLYVYSEVSYDTPFTKTVNFEQDINPEDYADEENYLNALRDDLTAQAEKYLAVNQYPSVNYTLSANLEKITDIGDVIHVFDERLGVNLVTHVLSYSYDAVLERYTEIQFGNIQADLGDLIKTVNNTINTELTINNQAQSVILKEALAESEAKILGTFGNSFVIYNGDEILIVDRLPADTANNVMRINSAGIGFSTTGISGTFTSAWTLDGTFNAQAINVINFTASLIKGGTLKLGSELNQNGTLELYDAENRLIGILGKTSAEGEPDKFGLKMFGADGSYILMNNEVGFAGYDRLNNPLFWVSRDEFHQKKSVIEEEITLCNKMRFIAIEVYDRTQNPPVLTNDGIGLVSVISNGG